MLADQLLDAGASSTGPHEPSLEQLHRWGVGTVPAKPKTKQRVRRRTAMQQTDSGAVGGRTQEVEVAARPMKMFSMLWTLFETGS